jgi:hypothetical protein
MTEVARIASRALSRGSHPFGPTVLPSCVSTSIASWAGRLRQSRAVPHPVVAPGFWGCATAGWRPIRGGPERSEATTWDHTVRLGNRPFNSPAEMRVSTGLMRSGGTRSDHKRSQEVGRCGFRNSSGNSPDCAAASPASNGTNSLDTLPVSCDGPVALWSRGESPMTRSDRVSVNQSFGQTGRVRNEEGL